jgi:hypothetical protein
MINGGITHPHHDFEIISYSSAIAPKAKINQPVREQLQACVPRVSAQGLPSINC